MAKNFIYLDCPDQEIIAKKSLEYLKTTKWLSSYDNWRGPIKDDELGNLLTAVPELSMWFDSICLEPVEFWILGYFATSGIHIDSGPLYPRMNFPLLNTVGTAVTEFYDIKNLEKIKSTDAEVPYWHLKYNGKDATLIDSYELTRPIIFNPAIPHRIKFNKLLSPLNPRLAFSMYFYNPPYHMLGLE
jgi:hypothetical protein